MQAKILTVSDGVAAGVRQNKSAPLLAAALEAANFVVIETVVVVDGTRNVKGALKKLSKDFTGLIVTTGGTGFGPRDLTPEGTQSLIQKEAHGIHEAMRLVNPLGRLSRGIAGVYKKALIINTPGSPKGSVECLEAVLDVLPHALELLAGQQPH